jgi:putative transposon-encoded protein
VKPVRSSDQTPSHLAIYFCTGNRFDIDGEEVLDAELKEFGNSAHATVPKRWRGADVKVVRISEPTENDDD